MAGTTVGRYGEKYKNQEQVSQVEETAKEDLFHCWKRRRRWTEVDGSTWQQEVSWLDGRRYGDDGCGGCGCDGQVCWASFSRKFIILLKSFPYPGRNKSLIKLINGQFLFIN